jgi:transcriptional regulator with AAA-type ATPase domain
LTDLFGSPAAGETLRRGRTRLHIIEQGTLVVNYISAQPKTGGVGLLCTFEEVAATKEIFAHGIHMASEKRRGPFVAINCATLPAELFEE